MNANLREEYEVPVLTIEAIEVHLSYLRPALEGVEAELPELRKEMKALDEKLSGKIESLDEKLSGKIEALDERLSSKIEAVDERLSGKIEALDEKLTGNIGALDKTLSGKIAAVDEKLSGKFESLADRLMKLQASLDGLKWFIGSLALIASGVSIAHSLGWL
jgi:chromosome segregation ATPase